MLAVIVPVLNNWKGLTESLESIKTDYSFEPFIIDNWRHNIGVAAAWNKGIKQAQAKGYHYYLIINDDILLAPYAVDNLIKCFSTDSTLGVVTGNDWGINESPYDMLTATTPDNDLVICPDFACFMLTNNTINKVGYFDEEFWPAYMEDNDYCHRVLQADLKCVRNLGSPFHHFHSKTQFMDPQQPVCTSARFDANRHYYLQKWGGYQGEEKYSVAFNGGTVLKNEHVQGISF